MQGQVFIVIEFEWDGFSQTWSKRVMKAFVSEDLARSFVEEQISGAGLYFEVEPIELVCY